MALLILLVLAVEDRHFNLLCSGSSPRLRERLLLRSSMLPSDCGGVVSNLHPDWHSGT